MWWLHDIIGIPSFCLSASCIYKTSWLLLGHAIETPLLDSVCRKTEMEEGREGKRRAEEGRERMGGKEREDIGREEEDKTGKKLSVS